jgi:hypothetical protein
MLRAHEFRPSSSGSGGCFSIIANLTSGLIFPNTMRDRPQFYRKTNIQPSGAGGLEAWLSPQISDPCWDEFLRNAPSGQYQQSSLWAEFKAGEGWHHHRVLITCTEGISGGFQILWKSKGLFRIGYVSKGPVAHPPSPALASVLTELLAHSSRELGLDALIAQLPDEVQADEQSADEQTGFIRSNPMKVIEATYLVDVRDDMETVRRRMNRTLRQCVRKSREQGVVVRAGSEADLPLFFNLMAATCRRQNSAPNPASPDSLRRLWQVFARSGSVEMAFVSHNGTDFAGRMNLIFGDRVTQWKKGWDGSNRGCHPNELLADHALEWAQARGYRTCDFSAISRRTAEHILAGGAIDSTMARSRDMFNLRLGGYPRLLPRARLFLPNPVLRWGFRNTYLRFEQHRERQLLAAITRPGPQPAI